MSDHHPPSGEPKSRTGAGHPLPDAAQRALAEAEERREHAAQAGASQPREIGGRAGPEPVRYGDWEVKGLASDF